MNTHITNADIRAAALAADEAWHAELVRTFGKDACNARYEVRGRGAYGSELDRLHQAYLSACTALFASFSTVGA